MARHQLVGAGPGRKRGGHNKARLPSHTDFIACLDELNFDPVKELVALFHAEDTHHRVKYEICKELMAYGYIKRKAPVEVTGQIDHNNLNISWNIDTPAAVTVSDTVPVTCEPVADGSRGCVGVPPTHTVIEHDHADNSDDDVDER